MPTIFMLIATTVPLLARQDRRWRFATACSTIQALHSFHHDKTRNIMAIITTASGLQYEEIATGEGAEAQAGQNVTVHYTGWLQNADGSAGSKFDSSKDRNDPFEFPLGAGRVIKGWDEGVQGMKIGGKRKLIIPSELGYGARGAGGAIPPNATLIFEVELLGL
ncbi:MAG: FKBP-type peptidyl-prolyl cis-trans isomerase FkpA [Janthinobacterium sp.]|jgi:FKBP-type peptidyl-prolyl cis-trans isomerase FkpA